MKIKLKAFRLLVKTNAFPKGYLHPKVFSYGEFGVCSTRKTAHAFAKVFIEKQNVTSWKIKQITIEVSI